MKHTLGIRNIPSSEVWTHTHSSCVLSLGTSMGSEKRSKSFVCEYWRIYCTKLFLRQSLPL